MALARFIDVPPSFISKMVNGEKATPAEHCRAIEQFTGGAVTCQELRPDDWRKYWPERDTECPTTQPGELEAATGQGV